ncbi:M4 family metallopeptidase [Thermoflavimicrobium daqui]|uniref:Neutral metalloproteinase n=1 Tax=Thermoflavimicrobium daqui TaxID=2137476 RepID=A0A364K449_9BACL|nr:M4 family metallopeptidase [Thermoflavimicrobium daqui]RAL24143.1 peptidase M4 family protein [Thermoflavimicrobium daqui]
MKKRLIVHATLSFVLLGATAFTTSVSAAPKDEKIQYNAKYKTPKYIGEVWRAPKNVKNEEVVWSYFNTKKDLFKLKGDAKNQFKIKTKKKDEKGITHYRVQQTYQGIPVYGADQTVHVDKDNQVTSYFGQVISDLSTQNIPTKASIKKDKAIEVVKKDLKVDKFDGTPEANLYIYFSDNKYHLVYIVKASTLYPEPGFWHYFVDATTGQVVDKFNSAHHVTGTGRGVHGDTKTFEVSSYQGQYVLWDQTRGGGIQTYTANNGSSIPGYLVASRTTTFNDPAAVDAHYYAAKVYDYYKNVHNRNSYDGRGTSLVSTVHYGRNYMNAFWNGRQMVYGDGGSQNGYTPFSAGLDVIAHEMTHGVTSSSDASQLIYRNQSGALNEAISDIIASDVDSNDWLMGEDINYVIRDLANPTRYNQPDHMSKYVNTTQDNGGVHINSGIINKAAYLMADGGSHYNVTVQGIGRAKMAKIFHKANLDYLYSNSDFSAARSACIQAATALYGAGSQEVQTVTNAFAAVGIH